MIIPNLYFLLVSPLEKSQTLLCREIQIPLSVYLFVLVFHFYEHIPATNAPTGKLNVSGPSTLSRDPIESGLFVLSRGWKPDAGSFTGLTAAIMAIVIGPLYFVCKQPLLSNL